MASATAAAPSEAELRRWRWGAVRGLRKAQAYSGISPQELRSLVAAGELTPLPWGDRGDLMFARRELAALLARRLAERRAGDRGAGART